MVLGSLLKEDSHGVWRWACRDVDRMKLVGACRVIASACRDQSLQLFSPVEHHVESTGTRFVLDHYEALAVGADVIVGERDVLKDIPLVEQLPRLRENEIHTPRHVHDHHLVSSAIEDLLAVPVPQWLCPALRGHRPPPVWAAEGPNIPLHL